MTRVTVVVPTFNGARYLREAIDSVLSQSHPEIECLVMDGGSKDGTTEILESYGDRIAWVSEPDRGQSDAIQKGFSRATGRLVGWLNADDLLMPDAIRKVCAAAEQHPDAVLFFGENDQMDASGQSIGTIRSVDVDYDIMRTARGRTVQPGSFYRRWAVAAAGGVDPSFYMVMDVDLWIRLLRHGRAIRIPENLARFRVHEDAKSSEPPWRYYREQFRLGFKHEKDQLVRATVRRSYIVARHFLIANARHYLREMGLNVRPSAFFGKG